MTDHLQEISSTEQCEHCHRKVERRRLTLPYLISDAFNNLFNIERGLIFTFWWLFRNPGIVVRSFVEGNRYRYMNPFRFLLVAATFSVIVGAITDSTSMFALLDINATDDESPGILSNIMTNYLNIVILCTAPFYALGTWLIYRKPKWNLSEHLVVSCYGISIIIICASILTLLAAPFDEAIRMKIEGAGHIFNLYFIYLYGKTWSYHWFKNILLMLISFVLSNVLAIFVAACTLILYMRL